MNKKYPKTSLYVLYKRVSDEANVSQAAVARVIKSTFDIIIEEVAKGNEVSFRDFGSFKPKECASRTGRNMKYNKPVRIPSRTVPTFEVSKAFKEKATREHK